MATFAVVAFVDFLVMPVHQAAPESVDASGFDANAAEQDLFNLVNQYRQQNGLAAAAFGPLASSVAQDRNGTACGMSVHGRAQDMVDRNYLSGHIPPCGEIGLTLLQSFGWSGYGGEMVGAAPGTLDSAGAANYVFTQFKNSYSAQLLWSGMNELGVGWALGCGGWTAGQADGFAASLFFLHDNGSPSGTSPAEPRACGAAPSPAPTPAPAPTPTPTRSQPPASPSPAVSSTSSGGGVTPESSAPTVASPSGPIGQTPAPAAGGEGGPADGAAAALLPTTTPEATASPLVALALGAGPTSGPGAVPGAASSGGDSGPLTGVLALVALVAGVGAGLAFLLRCRGGNDGAA